MTALVLHESPAQSWLPFTNDDHLQSYADRPLFFSLPRTIDLLGWNWLLFVAAERQPQTVSKSLIPNREIQEACERTNALRELENNWDGYRAAAPTDAVVKNAMSALVMTPGLQQAPEIVPNPNGTISLIWEAANGAAHLEIGESDYSFYSEIGKGLGVSEYAPLSSFPGSVTGALEAILGPGQFAEPSFTISGIDFR